MWWGNPSCRTPWPLCSPSPISWPWTDGSSSSWMLWGSASTPLEKPRWWPMTPHSPRALQSTEPSWALRAQSQGEPCKARGSLSNCSFPPTNTCRDSEGKGEKMKNHTGLLWWCLTWAPVLGQAGTAADPCTPNMALGWKSCDLQIWSWPCPWEAEGTLTLLCSTSRGVWCCWRRTWTQPEDEGWIKRCPRVFSSYEVFVPWSGGWIWAESSPASQGQHLPLAQDRTWAQLGDTRGQLHVLPVSAAVSPQPTLTCARHTKPHRALKPLLFPAWSQFGYRTQAGLCCLRPQGKKKNPKL